jgi:hypothetical protein
MRTAARVEPVAGMLTAASYTTIFLARSAVISALE